LSESGKEIRKFLCIELRFQRNRELEGRHLTQKGVVLGMKG
jgi:hypothetical protein